MADCLSPESARPRSWFAELALACLALALSLGLVVAGCGGQPKGAWTGQLQRGDPINNYLHPWIKAKRQSNGDFTIVADAIGEYTITTGSGSPPNEVEIDTATTSFQRAATNVDFDGAEWVEFDFGNGQVKRITRTVW